MIRAIELIERNAALCPQAPDARAAEGDFMLSHGALA